ncbi:helix-turn-helix domain-containing protein [Paenibacillus ginsengihumi]|uniref:helix-turn-helix domain-containing protein n=1 Tax=Paenibacillus ginsengihumi TaxID=431596 RepID=UPI000362A16D|nr:AraC family transcriptional regulator [Paenibacillus ginsengihumi]
MIVQIGTPQMELYRIEGEFSNTPHLHEDEYQITVPLQGAFQFTQESRQYSLQGGTALVQHPRDRHYFAIDGGSAVLIIRIRQQRMREFTGQDSLEFSLRQQLNPALMSDKFRRWMIALLESDSARRLAEEELEAEVLSFLTRTLSGSHQRAAWPERCSPAFSSRDPMMRQVLAYIHERYTEELTVEELAGIALQSRFHFIRSFKAEVGETPYQYVLRLRVEEAKRLLRHTKQTVTEIAFRLGFSSASQFYRVFVKAAGVSPERFRRLT